MDPSTDLLSFTNLMIKTKWTLAIKNGGLDAIMLRNTPDWSPFVMQYVASYHDRIREYCEVIREHVMTITRKPAKEHCSLRTTDASSEWEFVLVYDNRGVQQLHKLGNSKYAIPLWLQLRKVFLSRGCWIT